MQPDAVARALIKGMERGEFLIIPGFDGKLTFAVKRLFPGLVDFIMSRDIRKAQQVRT
jgi:short-subunit dehydrogenase